MKLRTLLVLLYLTPIPHVSASSPKSGPSAPAKINSNTNKIPNSPSPATQVDDNKDAQVVSESMGTMITALATFSQNPNNPVVAGACALQALGAFIKMLIQIFDDFAPTRNLHSQQDIEKLFLYLPKEKQMRIMQLVVVCAQKYKIAKEV